MTQFKQSAEHSQAQNKKKQQVAVKKDDDDEDSRSRSIGKASSAAKVRKTRK